MVKTLKERFDEKWIPEPNSGCWLWTACINTDKYGQMGNNGKTIRAHRISYELYKGTIPSNLVVRHKCDNPTCVNPDHLELGTHQDNMLDRNERGGTKKGALKRRGNKNGRTELTEEQVIEIFLDVRHSKHIAKEYNIKPAVVLDIRRGTNWSWLTEKIYTTNMRITGNCCLDKNDITKIYQSDETFTNLSKKYKTSYKTILAIKEDRLFEEFTKHLPKPNIKKLLKKDDIISIYTDTRNIDLIIKQYNITRRNIIDIKKGRIGAKYTKNLTVGIYEETMKERFEKEFNIDSNNCWIWKKSSDINPRFIFHKKEYQAKRISYELYCESIPPKAKFTNNICNNNLCVNPDHLVLLTHIQPNNTKLTKDQVIEIYIKSNNGYKEKKLAEEYNVSRQTINEIKLGKRWAWLTKDL